MTIIVMSVLTFIGAFTFGYFFAVFRFAKNKEYQKIPEGCVVVPQKTLENLFAAVPKSVKIALRNQTEKID